MARSNRLSLVVSWVTSFADAMHILSIWCLNVIRTTKLNQEIAFAIKYITVYHRRHSQGKKIMVHFVGHGVYINR